MLHECLILKRNVKFIQEKQNYIVIGPLGKSLTIPLNINVRIVINHSTILIQSYNKCLFFLYSNLIKQKIIGVLYGFKKRLRLEGLGFIVSLETGNLIFKLGYSHIITIRVPPQLKIFIKKRKRITILGSDLNLISQFALTLRNYKPPEIYKGKGIRYFRERLKLKIGKRV